MLLAGIFIFILGTFLGPVAALVSPYALVALQILKGLACVRIFTQCLHKSTFIICGFPNFEHCSVFESN